MTQALSHAADMPHPAQVEELNLFTDHLSGLSKGSGFVTMHSREHALNAIDNLDEQHTMEVSLLQEEIQALLNNVLLPAGINGTFLSEVGRSRHANKEEKGSGRLQC